MKLDDALAKHKPRKANTARERFLAELVEAGEENGEPDLVEQVLVHLLEGTPRETMMAALDKEYGIQVSTGVLKRWMEDERRDRRGQA